MKTITRKASSVSLYLLDDSETITMTSSQTIIGSPVKFIVSDCSTFTALLHENIKAPTDWMPEKFKFDGATWTPNPDWVDPSTLNHHQ